MAKSKVKQIEAGAIITYFTIGFSVISGLLYTPYMIETIGQTDYGVYTLANSLISLFLVDFGLGSATARYVAKYRNENDMEGLNKFLNIIYRLYLAIDSVILLILVIFFFFIDVVYQNLLYEEVQKFKIVYSIIGFYSVLCFPCITFNGILNAFEKFVPLKLIDLFQKVAFVTFTLIALSFEMGLYALVFVNVICGLGANMLKFHYVRKSIQIKTVAIEPKERTTIFKSILKFSLWSTIWALSQRLIFNITPTLLGIVVPSAATIIAVFGIIATIEGYFYTITTAINGMFLSRITRLLTDDVDGKKITALAVKVGRFQFALNGLLIIGFVFVGQEFISFWVGEEFIEAYLGVLLIVLPGLFYNALQIIHTAIVVQNLVKYQAYIQIVSGVCNVIGVVLLSPLYGVTGAAFSVCIAYFIRLFLTLALVKKKMKFRFSVFFRKCYVQLSFPIAVTMMICQMVFMHIKTAAIEVTFLKIVIVVLLYLTCFWWLGANKAERRNWINKIIRRFKSYVTFQK